MPKRMTRNGKPCYRVKGYTRISNSGKKHHVKAHRRCHGKTKRKRR